MAALLRSGKFLRMVSGLTRQQVAQPNAPPLSGTTGPDAGASPSSSLPAPGGFESTGGASFQAWSLQHLQSALPALSSIGCVASNDKERENNDPLRDFLNDSKVSLEPVITEGKNVQEEIKKEAIEYNSTAEQDKKVPAIEAEQSQGLNLFKNDARLRWEPKTENTIEHVEDNSASSTDSTTESNSVKSDTSIEITDEQKSLDQQDASMTIPQMVPVVPLFDSNPEQTQWFPLPVVCQMFRQQGRYWDLECLLEGSKGIRPEDRKTIYFWTLQAYADVGLFDRAVALSGQLHVEGLGNHFPEYHHLMSSFAAAQTSFAPTVPYSSYAAGGSLGVVTPSDVSLVSSPRSSCPPTPAPEDTYRRRPSVATTTSVETTKSRRSNIKVQAALRHFKKVLNDENVNECLSTYNELNQSNPRSLNITELSSFIELLVKVDKVTEATSVAENMLAKDMYPMPKIFRFLLNRLASNGDVTAMTSLGQYLTSKVKKEVSYDNRLCNAYLASGRGAEYLELLMKELDQAIALDNITDEKLQSLKDKFPRGGAMGLLESNPELVGSYTDLAHKFLQMGYIAPMNVLWTYHFIGGRHDLAMPLWEKYVKTCPQIMFQKVCQTARATSNADLAQRLVVLLENAATVTVGARGIAYSCLLDVLTQRQEYEKGVKALEAGLKSGVSIDDMNRTALKRLKEGLESTTKQKFPFEIPKKSNIVKLKDVSDNVSSCHSEVVTAVAQLN